jgi:hypothetical protein
MPAASLPLLTWREDAAVLQLADERQRLRERIARLPPMSHRRVELTARLKQLTADELRLELKTGQTREH